MVKFIFISKSFWLSASEVGGNHHVREFKRIHGDQHNAAYRGDSDEQGVFCGFHLESPFLYNQFFYACILSISLRPITGIATKCKKRGSGVKSWWFRA
jgi:hypothetical protein